MRSVSLSVLLPALEAKTMTSAMSLGVFATAPNVSLESFGKPSVLPACIRVELSADEVLAAGGLRLRSAVPGSLHSGTSVLSKICEDLVSLGLRKTADRLAKTGAAVVRDLGCLHVVASVAKSTKEKGELSGAHEALLRESACDALGELRAQQQRWNACADPDVRELDLGDCFDLDGRQQLVSSQFVRDALRADMSLLLPGPSGVRQLGLPVGVPAEGSAALVAALALLGLEADAGLLQHALAVERATLAALAARVVLGLSADEMLSASADWTQDTPLRANGLFQREGRRLAQPVLDLHKASDDWQPSCAATSGPALALARTRTGLVVFSECSARLRYIHASTGKATLETDVGLRIHARRAVGDGDRISGLVVGERAPGATLCGCCSDGSSDSGSDDEASSEGAADFDPLPSESEEEPESGEEGAPAPPRAPSPAATPKAAGSLATAARAKALGLAISAEGALDRVGCMAAAAVRRGAVLDAAARAALRGAGAAFAAELLGAVAARRRALEL
eukprot:tig00000402_g176.t1